MSLKYQYTDEFSLLRSLREGDPRAFQFIYLSHYKPLYHFAQRFIKDGVQSEDIIAEIFVTLWQKRTEFQTYKGLLAFVYTCTRNACLSYINKTYRHDASHKEIIYLFDRPDNVDSINSMKEDLIQYAVIESQSLPPAMKKVFQLLYIEGFSTFEIAEKLKVSVNTVRNQKATAIKHVRENLLKKGLLSWLV